MFGSERMARWSPTDGDVRVGRRAQLIGEIRRRTMLLFFVMNLRCDHHRSVLQIVHVDRRRGRGNDSTECRRLKRNERSEMSKKNVWFYLVVFDAFHFDRIDGIDRTFHSATDTGGLTDDFRQVVQMIRIQIFAGTIFIRQIRRCFAVRHHRVAEEEKRRSSSSFSQLDSHRRMSRN